MKKLFSSVSLMLVMALLASCGGEAVQPTVTDNDTESETTADPNDRSSVADGLPDEKFGGYEFTVLTGTNHKWSVVEEEQTGDVIHDSVYYRNAAVEERFGVKINVLTVEPKDVTTKVSGSIQSGDDDIDLCCTHVLYTGALALDGSFLNWYDVPYVDFSKPWWSPSTTEDMSVGKFCPLAIGDFVLFALSNTMCVFYNNQIAENFAIPNLYELVNSGSWTIDKLLDLTKDVYTDLNADAEVNGGDLFGFVSTARTSVSAYFWAFGGKIMSKDQNGKVEMTYHNYKSSDIITKLCSFFYDNDGIYINSREKEYDSQFAMKKFSQSQALFINGTIGYAVNDMVRAMTDDYGILPYPKWDEAQEKYATVVEVSHDVLGVPVTASDPRRTGIITEALNAESYKKVVPAYYETALKKKYTRDDESMAMLDLIVDSRVFDLGLIYDGSSGASFLYQNLIGKNDTNFESLWAAKKGAITAHYDEVIDFFNAK